MCHLGCFAVHLRSDGAKLCCPNHFDLISRLKIAYCSLGSEKRHGWFQLWSRKMQKYQHQMLKDGEGDTRSCLIEISLTVCLSKPLLVRTMLSRQFDSRGLLLKLHEVGAEQIYSQKINIEKIRFCFQMLQ